MDRLLGEGRLYPIVCKRHALSASGPKTMKKLAFSLLSFPVSGAKADIHRSNAH
jgi:hypothetical protein